MRHAQSVLSGRAGIQVRVRVFHRVPTTCHKEPIPPSRPQLGGSGAFLEKKRDRTERQDKDGEGFWKGKNHSGEAHSTCHVAL